ncbi:hypothetical protein E4U44_001146 [Claviceps purpurea]|nr:hypothetical protein E4U44_001146 [Claviceps purpurea]
MSRRRGNHPLTRTVGENLLQRGSPQTSRCVLKGATARLELGSGRVAPCRSVFVTRLAEKGIDIEHALTNGSSPFPEEGQLGLFGRELEIIAGHDPDASEVLMIYAGEIVPRCLLAWLIPDVHLN